ncbi:MAG: hypothetical protein ABI627_12735 [Polyangiaceae bacterium]
MSRQLLVVVASVALALGAFGASFTLVACGGSSSETPPPLEPDPRGFQYAPAQADTSVAADLPRSVTGADDDDPKPRTKAGSTWGGTAKPPAAPAAK